MAISSIGQYGNMIQNCFWVHKIPIANSNSISTQTEQAENKTTEEQTSLSSDFQEETTLSDSQKENGQFGLQDLSLSYHNENSAITDSAKGTLCGLDVQKAVSDMKKDTILEDYQYFVKPDAQNFFQSEDGLVYIK